MAARDREYMTHLGALLDNDEDREKFKRFLTSQSHVDTLTFFEEFQCATRNRNTTLLGALVDRVQGTSGRNLSVNLDDALLCNISALASSSPTSLAADHPTVLAVRAFVLQQLYQPYNSYIPTLM